VATAKQGDQVTIHTTGRLPSGDVFDTTDGRDPLRADADGQEIRVWVSDLAEETAVVDANHPLAGQILEFDLKLVSVETEE